MPDCIKIMYDYLVKYVVDDHTSDIPSNNSSRHVDCASEHDNANDTFESWVSFTFLGFFLFSGHFSLRLASAKSRLIHDSHLEPQTT